MILKEKDALASNDKRIQYGYQQEKDVAFHLRREFGSNELVLVFNDLRLTYNGENAQIDHLVIYPFGFIVIESKSISGEVNVNAEGEWSRSYQGEWRGMASPIRQAELQQALLKELLRANVEKFIRKILGIQGQVGGREWHVLCAVSSSAILDRKTMPARISELTVKSEFVVKHVKRFIGSLGSLSVLKGRPRFNEQELSALSDFLIQQDAMTRQAYQALLPPQENTVHTIREPAVVEAPRTALLCCRHCNEENMLEDRYGKYGYFIHCGSCRKNTPMKPICTACQSRTIVVNKSGPTYTATCRSCSHQFTLFQVKVSEKK